MALSQQERIEVRSADGTVIPVWRQGQGRPLVMIHGAAGGGANHAAWDVVMPHLATRFSVVTMDRRATLGDPSSRYALEREFEDIAAVMEEIGEEADVLGHSSGAVCALGASLACPNLRRLILYEPPLLDEGAAVVAKELDRLHRLGDMRAVAETFVREMRKDPAAVAAGIPPSILETAGLFPREMTALTSWHFEPERFAALSAPLLILVGEKTPPEHHHRGFIEPLSRVVSNVTVEEIPGQEHFAFRQDPALFSKLVLEFLETP